MSYGSGLQEAFGCLITLAVVGIVGFLVMLGINSFSEKTLESDELLTPTIKLEINNGKIDTLYIYKNK